MPSTPAPTRVRHLLADPGFRLVVTLAVLSFAAHELVPAPSHSPDPGVVRTVSPPPAARALPAAVYAPPVLHDSLGAGETLSELWERNGRPAAEMARAVEAVNALFDVRRLRSGTPIAFYLDRSGAASGAPTSSATGYGKLVAAPLDSVTVRLDADRTIALQAAPDGAFRGLLREIPVREVLRTHTGCVEGSLYAALESSEGDFSLLALELDRIYGGKIDFYSDLQPGDCVALHFQTFVRPDGSFRLGRIEAAELVNRGERHPAIWFEAPDGSSDYYDADGNSLRRQFLKSPLKFSRISSGFTLRRYHPILKRYRAHPGIDYAAPAGTPVQAAGNGVVKTAGWKGGYGRTVQLRHGEVYETAYAHLSRIAPGLRPGVRVSQGEVIGYVGSTGLSTGAHLDYRFSKNGKFVNPMDESLPTGDPIAPQYVTLFVERKDRALALLEEPGVILVDRSSDDAAHKTDVMAIRSPAARQDEADQDAASFGDD
ncbi:MAG: M23 family metallopeptidase [Gemmatimonadetes bacterium]|nr:M23 family metallopeptidase [Gemmatimonadota bacterium]